MSQQCTATAKSTGERCQKSAIKGGSVCYQHGGAAPQVQQKAQERLDRMADEVTADVEQDIKDLQAKFEGTDDPKEMAALVSEMRRCWKIVLDRTGHGPTEKRQLDADVTSGGEPIMVIERGSDSE